ncbi:uncharacterized protein LOC103521723 [Diaphorina citri]|uniref:ATP citrate synthase n=1 Tax=Diaphorina citri TaxID=121845 RepID=A0A3Q0JLN9_DIACI|nr:uncharacterized protein LOC103521723 [Diaphorina citri]
MLKLLTKSVLTLLSHTGFDDTTGSAVSVLTEVVDDYFTKFLSTLRDNTDNFFTPSSDIGFVDPMEATYQQMGIGSILVISDYYQNMVIGQRIRAKNRIIELYEELKDLYDASKKFSSYASNIVHIHSTGPGDRSGGMSNELNNIISKATNGVYEGVAIGGDRYPGTTFMDHILRYQADPEVKMIVLLGEVGGVEEYEVCAALKDKRITKPLVAWCIGTCASKYLIKS